MRLDSLPASLLHRNGYAISALCLIVTTATAALVGMRYMYEFRAGQFPLISSIDIVPYNWDWHHLHVFSGGLPFALAVLAIVLARVFAHYGACQFFGMGTDLPVLLPGPVLSGTLGGIVPIRSVVRSRAALICVGAAAPIAGFTVALATTCYGLIHSTAMDAHTSTSLIHISAPKIMEILRDTLLPSYPDIPPFLRMVPHPVLMASWVGLLITALNLLPAGRLDGGKIVYAISPRLHRITSSLTIAALLYLGTVEWIGWLFWAWMLMLQSMKQQHVSDHAAPGVEWVALAPVCFVIFLLTISTQPISGMSLVQVLLRMR